MEHCLTISQLIEQLQKCNPKAIVIYNNPEINYEVIISDHSNESIRVNTVSGSYLTDCIHPGWVDINPGEELALMEPELDENLDAIIL